MSWTAPPLLKYYSNKVNIYCNDNFIPVPPVIACPAPPIILLEPVEELYECDCSPPIIRPMEQPLNPVTALRNFHACNLESPPAAHTMGTYVACSNIPPSAPLWNPPIAPTAYAAPSYATPAPPAPLATSYAAPPAPSYAAPPATSYAPDVYSCKSCGK